MFAVCGWALGLFLIALGAFAAVWSNLIIAEIAIKYRLKNYSDIARKVGGQCLSDTLSILIIIYLFGACITYQIILTSLAGYVCVSFGMAQDFANSMHFRTMLGVPLTLLIFIPVSLLRDISSFQIAGVATIVALFYTMIVMVAEMPFYYEENKDSSEILLAKLDLNIFTCCSMTFFAFTC
mmetsp:Transcript_12167/g.8504  ORF Transcript_12167/g.8504 Transcript_12167/m.8504 type:complete len:181 (+) Transcript_12167:480-1022(+)